MIRFLFPFLILFLPKTAFSSPDTFITVSGFSSGAFMATQLHVAHSKSIKGVAMVAGGPYGCSQGRANLALFQCMRTYLGPPDGAQLFAEAIKMAEEGLIDPISNLNGSRVVLVTSENDTTVRPSVVYENKSFYALLPETSIKVIDQLPMGHAFPTLDFGSDCESSSKKPWISECDRDVAGEILDHLYSGLKKPVEIKESSFFSFPQPEDVGMDESGVAYVPESCREFQCPIHMSLHGCAQGTSSDVGNIYYRNVGFNRWAESNGIIIVYPQAISTFTNPSQCWDWWGYLSRDYLSRQAPQISALKGIMDKFAQAKINLKPL